MSSAVLSWMRDRVNGNAWGVVCGVLVAAGLFIACKPKTQGATAAPDTGAAAAEPAAASTESPVPDGATETDEPIADGPTSRDPDCGSDGKPWNGNPKGCLYEHDGCCYPDPGSLCAAAGCSKDDCNILESQPAQARC